MMSLTGDILTSATSGSPLVSAVTTSSMVGSFLPTVTSGLLLNEPNPVSGVLPSGPVVSLPVSMANSHSNAASLTSGPLGMSSGRGNGGCGSNASGMCDEKTVEYLRDLIAEKQMLEATNKHQGLDGGKSIVFKLLEQEITRIQSGGKPPGRDSKFVDIYHEKPIRLTVRALVPVKEHPKFNFVGKLLGPKGNSMKRLQEDTLTKMAVLGRGSMRNKQQEEDLRNSNDPKYSHLSEDLHVEITAFAPPSEAHARVAYALTEVRKYLIPDSNDEIRQKQMREMELINIQHGSSGDSSEENASSGEGLSPPPSNRQKSGSQGSPNMLVVRGLMQHSPQHQQSPQAQQSSQSHNQLQHHNSCKMVLSGQNGRLGQIIRSSGGGGGGGGGGGMNSSCNMGNRLNANKVLSILDRIRHGGSGSPDFVQSHHKSGSPSNADTLSGGGHISALSPASFVDAINLVEETGLCYEDLENSEILCGKSLKSSSITRNRLRMQISPYPRPK